MTTFTRGLAFPASDLPPFDGQFSDACLTPTSLPRTPTLTPRTVEPEQLDESASAAERVAQIRWLQVVARERTSGTKASYTIHLFMEKPHSHLHTPACVSQALLHPPESVDAEPDVCISRRASEFHTLRHALLDAALESPHKTVCPLCVGLETLLTFSSARPAMIAWPLLPSKTKIAVLNSLLHGILKQYRSSLPPPPPPAAHHRHACQGMRTISLLLDAFLCVAPLQQHHSFSDSVSDISYLAD